MNPAIRLIATIIVGAILVTLAVTLGMVILGLVPGHEHAMPMYTIVEARGHGGHK